jgi:hypothetical protein
MRELASDVAARTGDARVLSVADIESAMRSDPANHLDGDRSTMTQQEVHDMVSRYQGWPGNGIVSGEAFSFDSVERGGNGDGRLSATEAYRALASRRADLAAMGITLRRTEPATPERPATATGVRLRPPTR